MTYCIAIFCRKIVNIGDSIITKERLTQGVVKTLNKDHAISVATENAEKQFPGFEIVYINSVVL
jgi:hypothetical protein